MAEEEREGMVFTKPSSSCPTPYLFVANCGPAVGLSLPSIHQAFAAFGPLHGVQPADPSGSRVVVIFRETAHAQAALQAWNALPCKPLHNRVLHMQFSVPRSSPSQVGEPFPVCKAASEMDIPGLYLYTDFISVEEEKKLLAAVDERPWQILAKRRVQHYGYEFKYKTRDVNTSEYLGGLPAFVEPHLAKFSMLPELVRAEESCLPLDQLTVNEYPLGVGLSPHIDTHSAFEGAIFSLSLAGPCVMEFRRYYTNCVAHTCSTMEDHGGKEILCCKDGIRQSSNACSNEEQEAPVDSVKRSHSFDRRAIFLPQRSLLVLCKEARYGWHHYIPHHKVDFVDGLRIQRSRRRVSFTFRKIRLGPCTCNFEQFCDSQALIASFSHLYLHNGEKTDLVARLSDQVERLEMGEAVMEVQETLCNAGDRLQVIDTMDNDDPRNNQKKAQNMFHDHPSEHGGSEDYAAQLTLENVTIEMGETDACEPGHITSNVDCISSDLIVIGSSYNSHTHSASVLRAPEIEKKYVHGVYDAIAPHFNLTRFAKWPKVSFFLDSLAPGSVILDAGCGNGKYLGLNPHCIFIGCDLNSSLVSICGQRGHEVLVADTVHLPCKTDFCDAAISIGVLHHFNTEEHRKKALLELLRVVCSGGKVLITVWEVEQEDSSLLSKWNPLTFRYIEEWVGSICLKTIRRLPVASLKSIQEAGLPHHALEEEREFCEQGAMERTDVKNGGWMNFFCSVKEKIKRSIDAANISKNQMEQQDFFIPWHLPYHHAEVGGASAAAVVSDLGTKDDNKGAIIYNPYYHVFVEGELERLGSNVEGVKIVDHCYDESNWCIILEKL